MIWSLAKILAFIVIVVALTFGAAFLLQMGGHLNIAFQGWEVTLGPVQALVALILFAALVVIVLRLLGLLVAVIRFLTGDETAISRHFVRNRERKGYNALAEGMLAIASGEPRKAMSAAQRAERLLGRPELTTLVAAQAAELSGDTAKATEAYKRLLTDDRTRFVGVRGILKQKLAEGDTETALKLAERAFALKPRHEEMQDTLLHLQAGAADWSGARKTLAAKRQAGNLPRDVHRRRDAVLALEEAKALEAAGKDSAARDAAIAANRESPDLVPAAAMAARAHIAAGSPRAAAKVLRKAWESAPHPELAAAFAQIAPTETPAERLKRFRFLTDIRPTDEETKLLMAELNLAAEDFAGARRALGDLPQTHPTARALALMAAIERGEGSDDAVVRGWLTRALTASRGPQWICDKCSTAQPEWHPVCPSCGGFDTLSWREPPLAEATRPGAEFLPLIVGTPGKMEEKPEVAEAEIVTDEAAQKAAN
ncbi:MAG: heme biosynthesis protein HemY [Paracoccaceae bacterium]|nr:heme biosynthesis protein HemY [Paracoccaceae bacterium]